MKITNAFGMRFSGTIGKACTAASWKGVRYLRSYTSPRDGDSPPQRQQRDRFADAVDTWHMLTEEERNKYNRAAKRMTGFNLFVRQYLQDLTIRDSRDADSRATPP